MSGIPPAKDSDAEDVVWGLQTAEALWKRGERLDAIVWLRRAAQAAGDASDDDRALELARFAAELSESMSTIVPPGTSAAPPPSLEAPVPSAVEQYDASTTRPYTSDIPPPNRPAQPAPPPGSGRPEPPRAHQPSSPTVQTDPGIDEQIPIDTASDIALEARPPSEPEPSEERGASTSVPPADMVHAGMFNPWDEGAAARMQGEPPPPAPIPGFPTEPERFGEEEEVITSVRPQQLAQQRAEEREHEAAAEAKKPISSPPMPQKPSPPRPVAGAKPGKPPPLPPRALKKSPRDSVTQVVAAPVDMPMDAPAPEPAPPELPPQEPALDAAPPAPQTDPTPMPTPPPSDPADIDDHTPVHAYDARHLASTHPSPLTPPPPSPTQVIEQITRRPEAPESVDLEGVELFSDLPDDSRAAFAAAATLSALGGSEEVSHFALAYVIEGAVDVASIMVDAPALRLVKGSVLRTKGTTEEEVPMRLIGVDDGGGVVATWPFPAVEEAFRTCPWVEQDLRVAADKVLTLVGITIGPLGERLDQSIREHIVGLLTMRSLAPGEIVVTAGETVPGLLLIGVGEIELVTNDIVSGIVGCGDFLFAGEVLGAGNAPATARAGTGGALVLFGDRLVAQELLVTCPPLVEVLAGM